MIKLKLLFILFHPFSHPSPLFLLHSLFFLLELILDSLCSALVLPLWQNWWMLCAGALTQTFIFSERFSPFSNSFHRVEERMEPEKKLYSTWSEAAASYGKRKIPNSEARTRNGMKFHVRQRCCRRRSLRRNNREERRWRIEWRIYPRNITENRKGSRSREHSRGWRICGGFSY